MDDLSVPSFFGAEKEKERKKRDRERSEGCVFGEKSALGEHHL